MSKKIDQMSYEEKPLRFGEKVKDRLPKGDVLRKAKVTLFKKDGSLEESVFDQIEVSFSSPKKAVTVRFDQEVLDYFKSLGSGYQSKMNAVLKAFVDHEKHLHH